MIQHIENGLIQPSSGLDIAFQLIKRHDYEKARYYIFYLLPYLNESDTHGEHSPETSNNLKQKDQSYNITSLSNSNEMRRAFRLVGLSFYNNQQFEEALTWFKKAAEQSNSNQDWFNLASTASQIDTTRYKQEQRDYPIQLAKYAFHQLELLHEASQFQLRPSFWQQCYYYIISLINGKHFNEALNQLNRMKQAYKRARFTDTSYLGEVGLPPFDNFLSLTFYLFKKLDRLNQGIEFLRQIKDYVDEAGKKTIDEVLRQYKGKSDTPGFNTSMQSEAEQDTK